MHVRPYGVFKNFPNFNFAWIAKFLSKMGPPNHPSSPIPKSSKFQSFGLKTQWIENSTMMWSSLPWDTAFAEQGSRKGWVVAQTGKHLTTTQPGAWQFVLPPPSLSWCPPAWRTAVSPGDIVPRAAPPSYLKILLVDNLNIVCCTKTGIWWISLVNIKYN
jgi:hypothetical protein